MLDVSYQEMLGLKLIILSLHLFFLGIRRQFSTLTSKLYFFSVSVTDHVRLPHLMVIGRFQGRYIKTTGFCPFMLILLGFISFVRNVTGNVGIFWPCSKL